LDPLYKDYFADRARPAFSIDYLTFYEGFPDRVLQDKIINGEHDIKVWTFNRDIKPVNKMVQVSFGETLSLGRNTFTFDNCLSPISFDISMQGLLQSFYQGGFDDNIGFDGIYFVGGTLRIADFISSRIGIHHYCSHYGDSILKSVYKYDSANPDFDDNLDFDQFNVGYKYIRMNAYVIGLSIEPSSILRLYAELNFPPKSINVLRPNMFAPNWKMENVNSDYPNWYNDRIVNVGVEFTYPIFKNLGNTTLGYDLHMYEEGKIVYDHINGGAVEFDEDAPWELEHNVRIAQDLNQTLSFEVTYHNGRSPFNNFYFQHTSYFSLGLRYNPDNTNTIVSNKKN
jgi:hypothetical protein